MYKVEKQFSVPIGHRLSKHLGRCKNFHGHNMLILVGIRSSELNENDMVMDFSDLKQLVGEILDSWDHALFLNKEDTCTVVFNTEGEKQRIKYFDFDPTAERLSRYLFMEIKEKLPFGIFIDYVTIYENERSKATYLED